MEIRIKTDKPYTVYIENGILEKTGEIIAQFRAKGTKVMIMSETNVFRYYGTRLSESLKKAGFNVSSYVFIAGEESKNMKTVMEMYEALTENGFTRSDIIVNLGGGVTGDMGGFVAATYLRGIDFVQVPTSLLSQVDASVGGKTGIDLPSGKNLVGAFHQPLCVICDPETLKTLPKEYFIDGLGEVVKYGCIYDKELFFDLETGKAFKNMAETIYRCVDAKRVYVEDDTKDTGRRMILNFGHTFGHALEKLHDFKELSHGRAVAIGMLIASEIGESMNITKKGTSERIRALLIDLGLPTQDKFTLDDILDATALDKKTFGRNINLIFLNEIGSSLIHKIERNYLILRCKIMQQQKIRNNIEKN
ncbi:MAG: 3-dehydroquinate synthase [Ruminococcaceae bacterium]|nr:3-dehydroquinate synthase [Oscillospiraceae bacterium]